MEQNNEMLERFRAMLGTVDEGLNEARSRRLGRSSSVPSVPPPITGAAVDASGRPRFKAVRIAPPSGGQPSDG